MNFDNSCEQDKGRKVKVKTYIRLGASLIKHYAMKTYWGVDVEVHVFLTSALAGDEWSLLPDERALGTHWI
jgi:hypothetical protein